MMTPLKALCAALLAGVALAASAEEASPAYVGGSWGVRSLYSVGCMPGDDCSYATNRSGKLFGGYTLGSGTMFSRNVTDAVELSVFAVHGKYTTSADGWMRSRAVSKGLAASWARSTDLGSGIALNSRLGVAYSRSHSDGQIQGYSAWHSNDRDRFGVTAGLGLSYALTPHWSLRADYDYLPIKYESARHVNMWSLGAAYQF